VGEYRQLEAKRAAKTASGLDNREFLETCNIRVALIRRSDNLPFADRIEELINRTNQMNFTNSRVSIGSMGEYLVNPRHESFSVFVWDDFGFYGLVGFAAITDASINHLTYSCRIMNMGVEQAVGAVLLANFPAVTLPHEMFQTPWIKFVDARDQEFLARLSQEIEIVEPVPLRVMANCQSGAIVHYLGVSGAAWDNWPRIFRLREMSTSPDSLGYMATYIYGAFNDYSDQYWDEPPTIETYTAAAKGFVQQVKKFQSELIVVLPSENFNRTLRHGISPERFRLFNQVWREIALEVADLVKIVEVDELLAGPVEDPRHFSPELLKMIATAARSLVSQINL
jgi:hypothetical protein